MATVDVAIPAGQSNMVGRGVSGSSPSTVTGMAYEWHHTNGLVQLNDPTNEGTSHGSLTGSLLPAFANAFTAASERPIYMIPTAVGGTGLAEGTGSNGDWSATGARYAGFVSRTNSGLTDIAAAGHTIANVFMLWHQGETDAKTYAGPDRRGTYTANLIDLLTRARTDLSLPNLGMYVFQLGTSPGWEIEHADIQDAQSDACAATDGMVMVYTRCKEFFDLGWMKPDNVHYNQSGLNDMGDVGGLAAAVDLGFEVPPPPNPIANRSSTAADRMFSIL